MSRIALVVSDVDGTLVTKDKRLTDDARAAVRNLRTAALAPSVRTLSFVNRVPSTSETTSAIRVIGEPGLIE